MLRKVGRWASARLQGTKGVKKYDKYIKENPWVKTALGAGDLALAFYGPGLLGKGLQKIGGAGKLAGTGFGRAATSAGNFLAGTPAVQYQGPGTTGAGATKGIYGRIGQKLMGSASQPGIVPRLGDAARAAGRFAADNPSVIGAALQAAPALAQQSAMARQSQMMNAFALEEAKAQAARRKELMELLRPLFVQLQQGG
jgi:hypothetical protein